MSVLPWGLVEHFRGKNGVLFLGPDIATAAKGYLGLPASWQLADSLANELNYRGRYLPLSQIAMVYEQRYSKRHLIAHITERLNLEEQHPLPIHNVIATLPTQIIVHTGWDTLLERALQQVDRSYEVIYQVDQEVFIDSHPERLLIYKPFGTLEDPASLIITEDQQQELYRSSTLLESIRFHLRRMPMLVIGYAPDYDTILAPLYHPVRVQSSSPPAFVVQSISRAQDADYLATWDIRPIIEDPLLLLYELAKEVSPTQKISDALDWDSLSSANPITPNDVHQQVAIINRALDTLGVGPLVEQASLPLLSVTQIRELEQMREAYLRLTAEGPEISVSSGMWLRQGNIEYARQNYELATDYYKQVLAQESKSAEAYYNLHHALLAQSYQHSNANEHDIAQQMLADALAQYNKAIELQPDLAILPSQYTIEAILGQGGIGIVYRVSVLGFSQTMAVKLLRHAHMHNERAKLRFQREAIWLEKLGAHPNIVRANHWDTYKGRMHIVMDDLGHTTLASRLLRHGRIPLDEANIIAQQVGAALKAAHDRGIIHRDLKPSNIFLVNGIVKLIDFGLAVELDLSQASFLGIASGSIRYMSPEQRMGLETDVRTDVYALATLFYEMLTGFHPGEGTYRTVSEICENLSPTLDMVIEKARKLDLVERFDDIEGFCFALQKAVDTQPDSQTAPAWRRAVARYQERLNRLSFDYWWIAIIVSAVLGLGVYNWVEVRALRVLIRGLAMIIWGTVFLNIILTVYTTFRARQTGYYVLATFGGVISTLLSLVLASSLISSIAGDATLAPTDFMGDFLFVSFVDFLMGIISIGTIFSITRWVRFRGLSETHILVALIISFTAIFALISIVLQILDFAAN